MSPQGETDIDTWRAAALEQILEGMQEMLRSLVDNHMLNLLEPIEADISEIHKRQVVSDKLVSRLSNEVASVRVTGQGTQDQIAVLSARIEALTKRTGRQQLAGTTAGADRAAASGRASQRRHAEGIIASPWAQRRSRAGGQSHEPRFVALQGPQRGHAYNLRPDPEGAHDQGDAAGGDP